MGDAALAHMSPPSRRPLSTSFLAVSLFAGAPFFEWCHHDHPHDDGDTGGGGDTAQGGFAEGGASEGGAAQGGAAEGGSGGGSGGQSPTVRPALAVVVDFADVGLEDWYGPGFRDVDALSDQLHDMEAHWSFLSRGLEEMRWDIVRVTLSKPLSATAYPDWVAFRDETVTLAKQQIDVADYDIDGDGVVDTLWAIATTMGTSPPYLIGGASRNQGANIFVDGQDSGSVVSHATGNFNHEVGHTRGLPDMYGDYGSLSDLTLMASSWPTPANDFAAFERVRLGWVTAEVVEHTTADLQLLDANDHDSALRIPTARPEEYFLLEYRKRPTSGFGSSMAFDVDGVAVYHVLEGSSQWVDPPLVKLEPADGTTQANLVPEHDDFAYPGNPGMTSPFVLHTYFGGDDLFRLENLRWSGSAGIAFDLVELSSGSGSAPNLVDNPSFESGTDGWTTGAWMPANATFEWGSLGANGSAHSAFMASDIPNDAEWRTTVNGLTLGRAYATCGSVRGQDVTDGVGASMSISQTFEQTAGLHGTFDFTRVCAVVSGLGSTTTVACRLGGFGSTSSGQMWCDDVSLTPLDAVFAAPSGLGPLEQEGVEPIGSP
jgi:hypothetical protein